MADRLEQNHWDVSTNTHFLDPDESKPRELDIRAYDNPKRDTGGIGLLFNMLLECKSSSEHSLVLFPRSDAAWIDIDGQYGDSNWSRRSQGSSPKFPKDLHFGAMPFLFDNLHYKQLGGLSNTYVLAKPNDNRTKPDIYEAVTVLTKAQSLDTREDEGDYLPMFFTFLVIVFDGPIFNASISSGRVTLNESRHSAIRSKYLERNSANLEITHVIDVVRRDHFPEYLKLIQAEMDEIYLKARSDPAVERYLTMRPS